MHGEMCMAVGVRRGGASATTINQIHAVMHPLGRPPMARFGLKWDVCVGAVCGLRRRGAGLGAELGVNKRHNVMRSLVSPIHVNIAHSGGGGG